MQRSQLSDMAVFVEVARMNGFRAAADRLKLKPGSVSEAVQRFEDRLGVRLFERSTRSVVLTPIGERLYEHCLPAISDLETAIRDLDEQRDTVSGTLRLSAPYSAGPFFLDKLVSKFAGVHPDVKVALVYNDQKVDLIESRIDAAIRSSTLLEPDTHAVAVGPSLQMAIVAAPEYLDRRGIPQMPEEVLEHDSIGFTFGGSGQLAPWTFEGKEGLFDINPKPRITANDLRSLLTYATAGLGISYIYRQVAAPLLTEGKLVELLAGQVPAMPRYSLNYRSKKHMTRRLRAFIELAKQNSE